MSKRFSDLMHGPRALKSGYCKESYLMTKQKRSTIRNLVAQTFAPRVVAKIFPKFTLLAAKKSKGINAGRTLTV